MLITFDIIKSNGASNMRGRDITDKDSQESLSAMIKLVEILKDDMPQIGVMNCTPKVEHKTFGVQFTLVVRRPLHLSVIGLWNEKGYPYEKSRLEFDFQVGSGFRMDTLPPGFWRLICTKKDLPRALLLPRAGLASC